MGRPKGSVGSKSVTQTMWLSILLVVMLFTLLDLASSARLFPKPSGFHSSQGLEGSVMDTPVEVSDAESNRGMEPVLQSDRPHDELYAQRVLQGMACQGGCGSSDCFGTPNPGGSKPSCTAVVEP